MNIGEIVAIATKVGEEVQKVPAIVTAVYNNAHGEVVADLHQLESTIKGVVVAEENPPGAAPENGPVVTKDMTPPAPPEEAASPAPAGPDAEVSAEESAYNALSEEDKAAFEEWQAQQQKQPGEPTA